MGLLRDVRQFSKYAWFMREGTPFTSGGGGIAAREAKPDGDDPDYIDLGLIEGFEWDFSGGTDLEVWRPSPGHLELYESREIKPKLTFKWTGGEVLAETLEFFFRAGATQFLDQDSAQFNPGGGSLRYGWAHFQCYDAKKDTLLVTFDIWGRLKITGGMKSEETGIMKPTYEFLKHYSSLNTAGLTDPDA